MVNTYNIFIDLQIYIYMHTNEQIYSRLQTSPHKFISNWKLIPVTNTTSRRIQVLLTCNNNSNKHRVDGRPIRQSITHQWHGTQEHSIV